MESNGDGEQAHIILLLVHVPDLEPDVRVGKGIGGALENLLKATEAVLILAALFVDDSQSEENFVRLVKV